LRVRGYRHGVRRRAWPGRDQQHHKQQLVQHVHEHSMRHSGCFEKCCRARLQYRRIMAALITAGCPVNLSAETAQTALSFSDVQAMVGEDMQKVDALIRHEPFLSMRVAPAQEPLVRSVVERLQADNRLPGNVTLQADPLLLPGACVVQSASGTLEIGVDAQLDALRKAVERQGASPGGR
jgi:hypothetical protein